MIDHMLTPSALLMKNTNNTHFKHLAVLNVYIDSALCAGKNLRGVMDSVLETWFQGRIPQSTCAEERAACRVGCGQRLSDSMLPGPQKLFIKRFLYHEVKA